MRLLSRTLVLAALGLAVVAPAFAADVNELETNGTAINNSLATAQAISGLSFTPNVNPHVFGALPTATILGAGGGDDVDFYSFQANAGTAYFDIDDDPFTFDTTMHLFDSTGTLIAFSDDSFPEDPGTQLGFDTFLGVFTLPSAGTYYITVSEFPNFANQLFVNPNLTGTDLFRPDGEEGGTALFGADPGDSAFFASDVQDGLGYTLHISLSNPVVPVPEPGNVALLLGAGISGAGMVLRRRNRK